MAWRSKAAAAAAATLRLTVNNQRVVVPDGATLLQAAAAAGVHVPTLCYHPRYKPTAVCRLCLVDVDGGSRPVPACSTKARAGDVVNTDSATLRDYRRGDLQFLLSRHPNDCMRCEVSGDCQLQSLVREEQLEEKWPKVERGGGKHPHLLHDHTSPSIDRDMDKCIECGLCVDACGPEGQNINVIGFAERSGATLPITVFDRPLADTPCISCGQCTAVCPVGALTERPAWHEVLRVLDGRRRKTVVQVAPATRVAISEEFGLAPGTVSTGRMVSALRQLGFDYVFDTNFAADLTILEEAAELLQRLAQTEDGSGACSGAPDVMLGTPDTGTLGDGAHNPGTACAQLPLLTSCCPGWVNYVEVSRPDLLPHLSTTKSPQQMHGAMTKRGPFASTLGEDFASGKAEPYVVSVMPCTAKKDEATRPNNRGDVDAVLTTRELARMIRARGIVFGELDEVAEFDHPLGESTGAGAIFGASGGVLEAACRHAASVLGAKGTVEFEPLRGVSASVKVADVPGVGKVAAINGIGPATRLLEDAEWMNQFVMIEVMACVGGCLGGGGEPKSKDPDVLAKRAAGIYSIDAKKTKRRSGENAEVGRLYKEFLGTPLSSVSHKYLHTTYAPRHSPRDLLGRFLSAVDMRDGARVARLFAPDAEWDTAGPLGVIKGRDSIQEVIDTRLPAVRGGPGFPRHRLEDAWAGYRVHAPNGERAEFRVELGRDGLIQSLRRTVLPLGADHDDV